MALYCKDGHVAEFPPPPPPPPRNAPWLPPDTSSSTCTRCGLPAWGHRACPPVLADELDLAIYAAAFVAMALENTGEPEEVARIAVRAAESLVELHRRARSEK